MKKNLYFIVFIFILIFLNFRTLTLNQDGELLKHKSKEFAGYINLEVFEADFSFVCGEILFLGFQFRYGCTNYMEYQFKVDTKFSFIPRYPSFIIGVHNYIENSLKFGLYKSEKIDISIIPTFGTSFDFLIIIFGTPSISLNTGVRFIFSHKIKENFSIYYGFPLNTTFNMSQLAKWIRYRYPAPFRIENNPEYRYIIIEDKFYLPTIESGFSFGFEIRKKNFFVRNEIFVGICAMSTYLKYINVEKETLFGIKREGYEFFYPIIIGGYSVIIGGRSD